MSTQIQLRRDSAANWTSNDPTLAAGEIGYEEDTGRWKIGDGATAWTSLGYMVADHDSGLYLPGSTGAYMAGPNLTLTGDIDIRIEFDWDDGHAAFDALAGDRNGSTGECTIRYGTGDQMNLLWWEGATARQYTPNAGTLADGERVQFRITRETSGADQICNLYRSYDWKNWTLIDGPNTQTVGGPTSQTTTFKIGSTATPATGRVYRLDVYALGGARLASPDFRGGVYDRVVDAEGNTWTATGTVGVKTT